MMRARSTLDWLQSNNISCSLIGYHLFVFKLRESRDGCQKVITEERTLKKYRPASKKTKRWV